LENPKSFKRISWPERKLIIVQDELEGGFFLGTSPAEFDKWKLPFGTIPKLEADEDILEQSVDRVISHFGPSNRAACLIPEKPHREEGDVSHGTTQQGEGMRERRS
jgi:hypothetical protein